MIAHAKAWLCGHKFKSADDRNYRWLGSQSGLGYKEHWLPTEPETGHLSG